MSKDIKLPELGEGVTEGELVKWLVKVGDSVKADQPVAEVMTDKATVEVPTPVPGVIKELKFKVGDTIAVEKTILILDEGAANAIPTPAAGAKPAPATQAAAAAPIAAAMQPTIASATQTTAKNFGAGATSRAIFPPPADFKTLATPATRRLARETEVDINAISGSGMAGRVTRDDVMQAKGGSSTSAGSGAATEVRPMTFPRVGLTPQGAQFEERVAIRGVRKKIAENMQMAKHIIPHFTLMDEAIVTELVALRESLKDTAEKQKTKITYLPFVIKAMISTVRQFPMFNASIDDAAQEIVYKKFFNIGFAADTPNGLMVPVIKNADQKSILELSREILDLSMRARDGKLKPDEMKGATMTITNIGSVGGSYATPIINHPEVAILGMYKISDKVVVNTKGGFEAVKAMNFTITCDHRLIDGAVAANFLKEFISRVQNPGRLMIDMM